jgi:hypothetical protein
MKHFIRFVAAFGLAAGIAVAQPSGAPPGGAFDIERLAVLLDLDPYQKGEVERVLAEQREARRAAREQLAASDERPSHEELKAQREQAREQVFEELKNILTESQMTKLKLLMEPPQGPRGRRGTPPAPAAQF